MGPLMKTPKVNFFFFFNFIFSNGFVYAYFYFSIYLNSVCKRMLAFSFNKNSRARKLASH